MRFYESRFPEVDELVMVQVKQIQEMGAYVKLLEYDNIEGMILLSELSRRRIRSIQKLIRVGRNEVVVVMRVDKEKGYIDLSKRRVSAEDVIKCEERYNKSKTVHSIMRHVAEKTGTDMDAVNDLVAWPLYKKYGHAYEAFKLSITEPESVFGELNIPDDIMEELRSNIARRLTPQPVKVRADLEVTNFAYSGILAIQEALALGEALSTSEIPIKIKLVAPPLYVMVSNTTDKQGAIELLEKAIETIGERIRKEEGGSLNVKMKPKAVSETEDMELAALMARVAKENTEVSGDEDSEGEA
ncbi:BZ3500_MvSof-1268-A1-R1_Chr5-2g07885 [Microbotryum saponariae]|uniref:Eukaryotic translation initiation factor 2 subunit alpha n=1 Tax=Microbotryum saponariae TaxID=289078 RepID=A0A2X0KIG0_9BASI|nr:BZ3500_MvSof-1268-A1-R1_Chr5-2g07885 [Microbotryum saponariae]SDA05754.1 BZ3501_MvSof-1269-A2-R1_Chr5-2g07707 [Microbotryum saponariae]